MSINFRSEPTNIPIYDASFLPLRALRAFTKLSCLSDQCEQLILRYKNGFYNVKLLFPNTKAKV